ncbi:sulfotransferase domain-containing protein [Fodinibius salsisoli]|uniref:Sulfotransferase domain-containing protein n=1 Tax=Fodinibius salsisoli TaxID=2820877 RepID=A0ABT3PTK4_9BACT|nr:sulfotransferase domain-containing protein [Fodinibius salsisoli]MCW9709180.1 sulfotransferase domain-containing protein [Fodinibius salsisoli]
MFPNFIIIGAMKCGTSSLYHYLQLHPELGMSAIKEVDFFIEENNYNKGISWYQSQFQGDFKIFGEASPNYSKAHYFKGVPRRMYELVPRAKLIYLVRDPIERIISHYTHNYSEGREHRSIEDALQELEDNHYVMCSKYFWQLQHYFEFFQEDQMLIIPSYRLRDERRATLQQIFKFLGVDDSFYSNDFEQQMHKTNKKRRKGKLSRFILESPVIKTLKGYIPDSVKDPVKKAIRPEVTKPELSSATRVKLQEYLHADVDRLRTFSGLSLDGWEL